MSERRLRSPDLASAAAEGSILAIQPIGSYEQHGPHLPLATDALIAEELTARAAALLGRDPLPWVLPTLSYGVAIEHRGRAGTVSLPYTTVATVCLDIARSVHESGARTLVFVNGHGGNPEVLLLACRQIRATLGLRAFSIHAPSLPLPTALAARVPDADVHGGFYETSVMLALAPGDVAMELAAADGIEAVHALKPSGLDGLPWHVDDLSASGVIGDPRGADRSWGEAALHAQAGELALRLQQLASLWVEG